MWHRSLPSCLATLKRITVPSLDFVVRHASCWPPCRNKKYALAHEVRDEKKSPAHEVRPQQLDGGCALFSRGLLNLFCGAVNNGLSEISPTLAKDCGILPRNAGPTRPCLHAAGQWRSFCPQDPFLEQAFRLRRSCVKPETAGSKVVLHRMNIKIPAWLKVAFNAWTFLRQLVQDQLQKREN